MSDAQSDSEAITASLTKPRSFGVIFERHFGAILRYLRRRLKDQPALEATAQTFSSPSTSAGASTASGAMPVPGSSASSPTSPIAEISELRAIAALGAETSVSDDGSEARLDAERMRGALARCLAELPTEETDLLYLLVWAELDQAEIAAALGVPIGTVKSRLSRARGRVREALDLPDGDLSATYPTQTRR